MNNFQQLFVFSVLFLCATKTTEALEILESVTALIEDDSKVVFDFLNVFTQQRNAMLCVVNSCDPQAGEKIKQIQENIENVVNEKSARMFSHKMLALQLNKAIINSVSKILEIEPKCIDPTYVCPTKAVAEKNAQSVYDYIYILDDMISSGKCIAKKEHIKDALDIMGKCVELAQQNYDPTKCYLERVMPSGIYAAKEFKKFCEK